MFLKYVIYHKQFIITLNKNQKNQFFFIILFILIKTTCTFKTEL